MSYGTVSWLAAIPPAAILAAGVASASRAGAALLVIETIAVFCLLGKRRLKGFVFSAAILASIAGAGTLWKRLTEADPLKYRREIFRSTFAMIAAHPWQGYGLGTFATVYPQFAEFDSGATVEHAHNDWLEWTAEGGVGFAALWAILALWISRDAALSIWGLGIPAVFLHGLVDDPFGRTGVAAWTFLLIGALAAERSAGANPLKSRRPS